MKFPIFFGLPSQKVPQWLVKVSPMNPQSRLGTVNFGSLVVVVNRNGRFKGRRLFPSGMVFRVDGCHMCNIDFQSPPGGSAGVWIDGRPLIPEWVLNLLVIVGVLLLL
jgi:hypothetical protein